VNRSLSKQAKLEIVVLLLASVSVIAALGWAVSPTRPEVRLTEQQGEQLNVRAHETRTMTRNDVIALLGVPEGDYRSDRSERLHILPRKRQLDIDYSVWIADDGYIVVRYNARTHHVINAGFGKIAKPPSLKERFDAWFLWLVQKLGI
jgi:hypothetical protein